MSSHPPPPTLTLLTTSSFFYHFIMFFKLFSNTTFKNIPDISSPPSSMSKFLNLLRGSCQCCSFSLQPRPLAFISLELEPSFAEKSAKVTDRHIVIVCFSRWRSFDILITLDLPPFCINFNGGNQVMTSSRLTVVVNRNKQ